MKELQNFFFKKLYLLFMLDCISVIIIPLHAVKKIEI